MYLLLAKVTSELHPPLAMIMHGRMIDQPDDGK